MSTRSKIMLGLAAVLLWAGVSLALLFIVADEDSTSVPCPSEDSCTVDYRDGAYHIEPVIP